LTEVYRNYGQFDSKINEFSVRVEICWSRISDQLELSKQIKDSITDAQADLQLRVIHILQSKLEAATLAISKLDRRVMHLGKTEKLLFAARRDTFEVPVGELEAWQKRFEPTWFQLIKAAPSGIDGTLKSMTVDKPRDAAEPNREALNFRRAFIPTKSGAFIAEKTLEGHEKAAIPYCAAVVAIDPENKKQHILDTASSDAVKTKDARDLATRLRDSNPFTSGILKCKGAMKTTSTNSISFVFRVPDEFDRIRSLRQLLLADRAPESLTTRLQIAQSLAKAVYFVHLYEFVHKNISPETILSLGRTTDAELGSEVCLVGFQVIRYAYERTNTAELGWRSALYQHPNRLVQGDDKKVTFVMQHDMYSLGVCLLEIGLWESLVAYGGEDEKTQLSSTYGLGQDTTTMAGLEADKQKLLALSRGPLRARMGDKYSKVVETCLTCLDEDNVDFGDPREFQDDDEIEVGAMYIAKVIDIMATISL
jgi:hypothetical protein